MGASSAGGQFKDRGRWAERFSCQQPSSATSRIQSRRADGNRATILPAITRGQAPTTLREARSGLGCHRSTRISGSVFGGSGGCAVATVHVGQGLPPPVLLYI
eukprot:scaffold865_cov312-Prasinococcus_capsulatus_cf.AAC.10